MKNFKSAVILLLLPLIWSGCNNEINSNTAASNSTNSGDDSSDFVENTTWDSQISIVWNETDVSISGNANGVSVTASDGYVVINSTAKGVEYSLSGSGKGQLSIYSSYKFKLSLSDLTLSCSDGPAVNNQCKKTCYVVLSGTNTLSDGSSYASSTEDRKAALFSEGQCVFSGAGSLSVTGNYKHALASDDYIRMRSGSINLTSKVSDGMHANDGIIIDDGSLIINAAGEGMQCDSSSVVITGGTINITSSGDKGILAYANISISGGDISIKSRYKCIKTESNLSISGGSIIAIATGSSSSSGTPEGIEAKGTISISGGMVYAQSSDDAINSGGEMTISGGCVMAYSTGNDGLDANGNCYIKGGVVYAVGSSSPEVGIDANTEGGYKLYIQGGTIVAIGGIENNASLLQSCYSTGSSSGGGHPGGGNSSNSWSANTWYALTAGDTTFAFKTPSNGGNGLVISSPSTPTLTSGVTATGSSIFNGMGFYPATVSGGSSVSLNSYSGNNGGGPGGR